MQANEIERIEDIIPLLQMDYTRGIKYLAETQLSIQEKSLLNRWRCPQEGFQIQEEIVNEDHIKYILCSAYIETAAPEKTAIIDENILPREHRVDGYEEDCIFFEINHRIYLVIMCPASMDAKVRSFLMGAGRGYEHLAQLWGDVVDKDIPEYTCGSDFFYWLTSKEGERIEFGEGGMVINNIKCLNNFNDRKDISYLSEGDNLLDETIPRATIGTNTNMELVGVNVNMENGTYDIRIQNDGTCFINESDTFVYNNDGTVRLFQEDRKGFILVVYNFILPLLRRCYHTEITRGIWGDEQRSEYRKRRALQVIQDLCRENHISIEEIGGYMH